MFSGVYEKLPDVMGYLNRIGITEVPAPTKENLDKLIYAHFLHVPYENVETSIERKCPDLSTTALYDKIVTRGRGGYCFELNGLFYTLLQELGYEVYPVACRMLMEFGALPIGHRGSILTIDGKKYFADVGTSGIAGFEAVPFEGQTNAGIYIKPNGPEMEIRKNNGEEDTLLLSFTDYYFDPKDFIPLNFFVACGPFSSNPVVRVNLSTTEGAKSINGDVFKVRKNGETTETPIESREMLLDILKEHFNIAI